MNNYEVGVYYFPNYHRDERNRKQHGEDWTEWELVKRAEPRYDGHVQPRVPLWGYEDESDPKVMAKKIKAAADSHISSFIFDWYWYNDGPFLDGALNRGFLEAENSMDLKFALMWANHDWVDIHPATRQGDYPILYPGVVNREAFDTMCDTVIEKYFSRPNYWRVDGGLYFSIYMPTNLVCGFGGIDRAREALDGFREKVRQAGLGELHLNAIIWGEQILPGEKVIEDVNGFTEALGFDSISSYVWIHHYLPKDKIQQDYGEFVEKCTTPMYREMTEYYRLPYYPNVTVGWDSSPRTIQSDVFDLRQYPFYPVLENNTPEKFKEALLRAKAFLDEGHTRTKVMTINAWNEWTEGSYLEPDEQYGTGFLDAIRDVF